MFCGLRLYRNGLYRTVPVVSGNQIDYILVRKHFRSGMKIARARSFPGADIGSDHDLRLRLKKKKKKISKPKHTRLKFDLAKLKDPNVL